MNPGGWARRSSSTRPYPSSSNFGPDGAGIRRSRGIDRQSRIPMRSSSNQGPNRDARQQSKVATSSMTGSTPVTGGKFTPSQVGFGPRVTPSCSSFKKMDYGKDLRNLHDKEYVKEASSIVQKFFQAKCPGIIINETNIQPMTLKMFIRMVNFLFETLGIMDKRREPVTFEVSTYEKELPYWMKKLMYPGLLTKAWLQTVNVPTNWPHVVALLSWLVKLCEISCLYDCEAQLDTLINDNPNNWHHFFFKKSLLAYGIYNEVKEEEYRNLCDEVVTKYNNLYGADPHEVEELEAEINELKEQLCDPNALAEKDILDEAVQKVKTLELLHEKIIDDMGKIEDEMDRLKAKISAKEDNCKILASEIAEKKKQSEKLKRDISTQPTTVSEVTELRRKTEYLDKEIKFLEKECEDYSQLISRYDFEAAEKRDMILQGTHAFNRNIIQLEQIIPELKDFRIYKDPENEELIAEMEKMVESLVNLKKELVQSCENLEMQIRKKEKDIEAKNHALECVTEMIAKLEESNEAKKAKNLSLEAEFEEKEKPLKALSENWAKKLKTLDEKVKEFNEVKEKRQKMEARNEYLGRGLERTEELADQFWERLYHEWKVIPIGLESMIQEIKDQNKEIQERYSQLMTGIEKDGNNAERA